MGLYENTSKKAFLGEWRIAGQTVGGGGGGGTTCMDSKAPVYKCVPCVYVSNGVENVAFIRIFHAGYDMLLRIAE